MSDKPREITHFGCDVTAWRTENQGQVTDDEFQKIKKSAELRLGWTARMFVCFEAGCRDIQMMLKLYTINMQKCQMKVDLEQMGTHLGIEASDILHNHIHEPIWQRGDFVVHAYLDTVYQSWHAEIQVAMIPPGEVEPIIFKRIV